MSTLSTGLRQSATPRSSSCSDCEKGRSALVTKSTRSARGRKP